MLKTKCIYAKPSEDDGFRIAIMLRMQEWDPKTQQLTPIPRPILDTVTMHEPSLAPDKKLFWDYAKKQIKFGEYKKRFQRQIRAQEVVRTLEDYGKMALERDVTFLCMEKSPRYCHRKLVAEEIQSYFPNYSLETS